MSYKTDMFTKVSSEFVKSIPGHEKYIMDNASFCLFGAGAFYGKDSKQIKKGVDKIYQSFANQFTDNWADLSNPIIAKCFEQAVKTNLELAVSRQGSGDVVVAVDNKFNILSLNCNGVSINCRAIENNSQLVIAVLNDIVDLTKNNFTAEEFEKNYSRDISQDNGVDTVIYSRDEKHIECNTLQKTISYDGSKKIKGIFTLTQSEYDICQGGEEIYYTTTKDETTQDEIVYASVDNASSEEIIIDKHLGLSYLKDVFKDDLKWVEYGCYLNMPIEKLHITNIENASSCEEVNQ